MLFLRKLLKLPSPIDLGWSDHNALQSREFTPDCDGYTWEDWDVEVKKLHPIKYFIAETLGDFLRYKIWLPIKRPFSDAYYWLVSHLIPSRRYHLLDLRQPCGKDELSNIDCYRYGWRDVDSKMLYAIFNLLGEYLNKEKPIDLTQWHTAEEIAADPCMKIQQANLEEARAIYHWWMVERKEEHKVCEQLLDRWLELRKNKETRQNGEADRAYQQRHQADQAFVAKTDEMIARLIKIRRSLWT